MIQTFVSILGILAFGAWIVAALAFFNMVRLVPAGNRMKAIWHAGFWQFQEIRALGGPQVDIHAKRFGWGAAVFFIVIFAAVILGLLASIEAHEASGAAASGTDAAVIGES